MKRDGSEAVDWTDLSLFLAVAREGGLSSASRVTGRSPATLGRRMHALERSLGYDLFVRHDRGYELTADAQALLERLSDVEANIDRLTGRRDTEERPLVKISAGTWTMLSLLDHFDEIAGAPTDVRLRLLSTERVLDIARREANIGFRNQRPTHESLAGRKLTRVDFAPYAVKDAPDRWIKVIADTPSAQWLVKMVGKDAVCEVDVPRNSLDLALAGKGIALLPTFIGDAKPALHRVGATIPELSHDQWIVIHKEDRHLPEMRRVIDRLVQLFGTRR